MCADGAAINRRRARLSVRRNQPCPCGRGRKHKHCHGLAQDASAAIALAGAARANGTPREFATLNAAGVQAAQYGLLPDAVHFFERALAHLNRQVEALADFDRALAIAGEDLPLLISRANALNMLGSSADALACVDKALALNPFNPGALAGKSDVLRKVRRDDEALNNGGNALLALGRAETATSRRRASGPA